MDITPIIYNDRRVALLLNFPNPNPELFLKRNVDSFVISVMIDELVIVYHNDMCDWWERRWLS